MQRATLGYLQRSDIVPDMLCARVGRFAATKRSKDVCAVEVESFIITQVIDPWALREREECRQACLGRLLAVNREHLRKSL